MSLDQRSKNTFHTRKGKRIDCNISNYVPFVVRGLSTSSSSTTLSPISPHGRCRQTLPKIQCKKEVEVQKTSFGETRSVNPQKPKTKIKKAESEEVQIDLWHDLPDWLQDFRECGR